MNLDIGGIVYPCTPFSGWYVSTEVGARNFSDTDRYNMLPTIGAMMELDMSHDRTLWKDRALVELNRAVIHSYRKASVIMVDHHTVAKQFIDHIAREDKAGRKCPTDWSWVNPPMSSSLTADVPPPVRRARSRHPAQFRDKKEEGHRPRPVPLPQLIALRRGSAPIRRRPRAS